MTCFRKNRKIRWLGHSLAFASLLCHFAIALFHIPPAMAGKSGVKLHQFETVICTIHGPKRQLINVALDSDAGLEIGQENEHQQDLPQASCPICLSFSQLAFAVIPDEGGGVDPISTSRSFQIAHSDAVYFGKTFRASQRAPPFQV